MASRYGCELCGDEDYISDLYGGARFAGDRTAKACTTCINEWARIAHSDPTVSVVFGEWLTQHFRQPVGERLTAEEAKAHAIEEIARSKALGELWDAWAESKKAASTKDTPS